MNKNLNLRYIIGALSVFLLIGFATEFIVSLLKENHLEQKRAETMEKLSTLRARLEGEINSTLHLTRGLIAYVATHPEVDETEFNQLSSEIISVGRNIRNLGLARNNIITHMYPLAGNEAALGLEYQKNPLQWPAVKKAMEAKGTIVAGPVNLVQGGVAFIARTPIYTRSSGVSGILAKHKPEYWGLASIVIDMPPLFQAAGISSISEIELAIRGKDGLGEAGDMITGNEELFHTNPVLQSVMLPNGSWQIAAIPKGGWGSSDSPVWIARLAGWLAALIIGALFGSLLWAHEKNRHLALHDSLTGLPNRRLLEDRIIQMIARCNREKTRFGIFYIDLDEFKMVNDQFGHETGDALLIEVSKRMQSCVRMVDTVARIGGDEYIILVEGISHEKDMSRLFITLKERLSGTAYINNQQLELKASIGTSIFPDDGTTLDQLMKSSDREMYQQKHQGKIMKVDFR